MPLTTSVKAKASRKKIKFARKGISGRQICSARVILQPV